MEADLHDLVETLEFGNCSDNCSFLKFENRGKFEFVQLPTSPLRRKGVGRFINKDYNKIDKSVRNKVGPECGD